MVLLDLMVVTPWTAACQTSLSFTISWCLLKLVHWVGDAIQPSHPVIHFFFCLQSFPASGPFPASWLFTSSGQSTEASASSPSNDYWFPLGLIRLIPCCPRNSEDSSPVPQFKSISSSALSIYGPTSHSYLTTGKTKTDLCHKAMSLLRNMLSTFVTVFFPRSNHLLISWLLLSTVILEPMKMKSATVSTFPLLFAMKWWELLL